MRIAVVSDIHGNLAALEAVDKDLRRRGVDGTVNLGDSLSGPLLPLETAQFLMAQDWIHLAGNHERQILFPGGLRRGPSDAYAHSQLTIRELDWIVGLEQTLAFGDEVLFCHGTPRSVRAGGGCLIVNPGSVGQQAFDDDVPLRHKVETGSPDARYAIVEFVAGEWRAALISVPYDPRYMAQLATQRDRPEWAFALLTGYLA